MNITLEQVTLVLALCGLVVSSKAEESPFDDYDNDYVDSYRNENCGLAPLNKIHLRNANYLMPSTERIINGERQSYGEWPSFVRIDSNCGGVLISDRQVLTAAHCVNSTVANNSMHSVNITLGDDRLLSMDAGEQVQHGVESICQSKRWREGTSESADRPYDYAVITLRQPARLSDHVQPACLPASQNERMHLKSCHLVGSGLVKAGPSGYRTNYLQKVAVRPAKCDAYEILPNDPSRSCWVGRDILSSRRGRPCFGDSGGPVLCLDQARRRWTVVAISSFGGQDCDYRGTKAVSGFTNVPKLFDQIKSECGI